MTPPTPRIAIIGGGPAGLTLGLLLHKLNITSTIFELRQKPTDDELAKPSGMLDLHEESGLAAIREAGLYNHFLQLTGECSEAQIVANKDGIILYTDQGELSERPEISRHALTALLTSHLPPGCIKYGYKLLSVSVSPSETTTTLNFGPNGTHSFDLVIGADGAWSRVRNILSPTKPHYAGTQMLLTTVPNLTATHPHLAALIGQGSFSALGLRHGIMTQRGANASARIMTFLSIPDEHFASSAGLLAANGSNAEAVKNRLLTDETLLGSFGESLKELVSVACDEEVKFQSSSSTSTGSAARVDIKPLYTLPTDSSFAHCESAAVTLIGDAAHLMCPWAGEGVNLAMWDSLLLSRAIGTAYHGSRGQDVASFLAGLHPLLRSFESDMFARTGEKAEETAANGRMLFGEDGAQAFKAFFESVYGEQ
ncbi:hypothetical protein BJX76DRAFT_12101 [Aspergillus varians]